MHLLLPVLLILAAVLVLLLGLVKVVHDLLVRGPYEAPIIDHEGLCQSLRYQGAAAAETVADSRCFAGAAGWPEQESGPT